MNMELVNPQMKSKALDLLLMPKINKSVTAFENAMTIKTSYLSLLRNKLFYYL